MKRILTKLTVFVLAIAGVLGCLSISASAYTPSYTTIKAGIYYGSGALESANLENAVGGGYLFGYFNSSRNFVSVGAYTEQTQISMLRDRNMYFSSASNTYVSGTDGSIVVGCYHIQLTSPYSTYYAAKQAADSYSGGFVKYYNGKYYVSVGSYTSSAAAQSAASSRGFSSYEINSGTEYTVAVVATKTGEILFEYDCGTNSSLAVLPADSSMISKAKTAASNGNYASVSYDISNGNQTWFKGYKYYGGFQYTRISGGNLTVVNFVNIEDYVKGVVPYEMSASWPIEALKTEACCARSYVVNNFNKHSSYGFDVCTTEDCQVYHGTNRASDNSDASVDQTSGKYIMYGGQPCTTYYSSCDGGATENSENVWYAEVPYLRGVIDPYEADVADSISGYYWTCTYTRQSLTDRLQSKGYSCSTIVSMHVTKYTDVGNVYTVTCIDDTGKSISFSKDRIRSVLGINTIRFTINDEPRPEVIPGDSTDSSGSTVYVNGSSATIDLKDPSKYYAIGSDGTSVLGSGKVSVIDSGGKVSTIGGTSGTSSTTTEPVYYTGNAETFVIKGSGNGHNVGMSQWGAYSMAKYHDKTYEEIIKFYFTGVTIE